MKVSSTLSPIKYTVCVQECPTKEGQSLQCLPNGSYSDCEQLTSESYPSKLRFERFCIPTEQALKKKLAFLFAAVNYEDLMDNLYQYRYVFLCCILLSVIFSNVYSFLLQKCTRVIVITCILGFYLGLAALGVICFRQYRHHKSLEDNSVDQGSKDSQQKSARLYLYLMIAIIGTLLLSLLILCFFIGKIILATKIIMVRIIYKICTHYFIGICRIRE